MRAKRRSSSGEAQATVSCSVESPIGRGCRRFRARDLKSTDGAVRRVVGAFWRGWNSLWLGLTKVGSHCPLSPRVVEYSCTYSLVNLIGGRKRHVSLTKQVYHEAATRGGCCCSCSCPFAREVPDSAPPRVTSALVLEPAFTDCSITSGAKSTPSARDKAISRQSEPTDASSSKQ